MRFLLRLLPVLCLGAALIAAQAPSVPPPAKQKTPSPPAPQQPAPTPERQEPPIFVGSVTEVIAPVTVTNGNGDFIVDLKPDDFRLYDNDVRQQIRVELSELPLSLAIVVSISGRIEPLMPQLRKSGILLTNLVKGETGEAAVITYDHRVEVAQEFTRDGDKLEKTFKDLKSGSDQARMNDAMVRALTMLRSRPSGRRKIILVIGEARDMGSETELGYVMREAQLGNISVYPVGLSTTRANLTRKPDPPPPSPFPPGATGTRPGIPPTPDIARQTGGNVNLGELVREATRGVKGIFLDNPLEAYAKGTGAIHHSTFSEKGLQQAVSDIGRELRSQYLITYRPNNLHQPGFHSIRVTVDRADVDVRTRPGYFYPGRGNTEAADSSTSPVP